MREMWQQDVLRYLTNRRRKKSVKDPSFKFGLHIPLKNVRLELGLSGDDAKLSNFINRNKFSAYAEPISAVDVFDKLVQPRIDDGTIDPDQELQNFHTFLRLEGIQDDWKHLTDYRQCLVAAFHEALPRRFPTDPEESALRGSRLPEAPCFVGRQAELSALSETLAAQGAAIVSGMGGIGKTVLAEEYARRNAKRYLTRQIVTAEPGFTSYKDLILAIQFDGADTAAGPDRDKLVEERMERLCSLDDSSLLIFDNLSTELDDYGLLRRLLRDSKAHIIVSTRDPNLFPEGAQLRLGALPPGEQLELLSSGMERAVQPDEREAAAEICRRIDGHTLVLQLLGRAVRRQQLTCPQMLQQLQGLRGFDALETAVRVQKDEFNKTIAIEQFIAQILFNLSPLGYEERESLRFLTLLPLDGVPRELLLTSPFRFDADSLRDLADGGWLTQGAQEDIVRLHPVVREAILREMDINSDTCTPVLAALDEALNDAELSETLPYLLRFASTVIDMLYISDPLRRFLVSDRLRPLNRRALTALRAANVWSDLTKELKACSEDEELLPETAATLRMYALFCEIMQRAQDAMDATGSTVLTGPFIDIGAMYDAVAENGDLAQFEETMRQMLGLFCELNMERTDLHSLQNQKDSPKELVQMALTLIGAEFLDYAMDSGLDTGLNENPRDLASVFTVLTPDERSLLETVSEPVYGSFLANALSILSNWPTLMPFVTSAAVASLTLLFVLQQLSTDEITTFAEIEEYHGWRFPKITYVPRGFEPCDVTYGEELWGRPWAVQYFTHGNKSFFVSLSRINSDSGAVDEFALLGSREIDTSPERTIYERGGRGTSSYDVQIGSWRIRVGTEDRISKRELLKVARGLQLQKEEPGSPFAAPAR